MSLFDVGDLGCVVLGVAEFSKALPRGLEVEFAVLLCQLNWFNDNAL